jgi:hypothetical protein
VSGRCDAAATEDLDALVFGAPRLLRHIHQAASAPQVKAVQEISLELVLKALKFSQKEFVDFCILCGCDYLGTIGRIGIQTAYQFMSKYRSIERILETLDRSKYTVPESWEYQAARQCFFAPPLPDIQAVSLEATRPDAQALDRLRSLTVGEHRLHAGEIDQYIQRLIRVTHGDQIPEQMHIPMPPIAHQLPPHQVQSCVQQIVDHPAPQRRPIATPSRPGQAASGSGFVRRRSGRAGTEAVVVVAKGQKTLTSLFASSRKRSSTDTLALCETGATDSQHSLNTSESLASNVFEGDFKRRRTMAESALRRFLGDDVSLDCGSCVEDLEELVAQLSGEKFGGNSGSGGELCHIEID